MNNGDLRGIEDGLFLCLHGVELLVEAVGQQLDFRFEGLLDVSVDARAVVEVLSLVEEMRHYQFFTDYKFICISYTRNTPQVYALIAHAAPQEPIIPHLFTQLKKITSKQIHNLHLSEWASSSGLILILFAELYVLYVIWIIISRMMRGLLRSQACLFGKFKQPNWDVGMIGQDPDLKGKEFDKFRRFFYRSHLEHAGKEMPNFLPHRDDLPTLERNEIETRILRIVRDLEIINLRELKFDADLRKDLKIDSLNIVALLTSIEHEFTTVFEDNVFEGIANLGEVVTLIMRDPKVI